MTLPPGYRWHPIEHMPENMPGLHLIREADDELMAAVIHVDGEWLATVGHHLDSSTKLRSRAFPSREEAVEAVELWVERLLRERDGLPIRPGDVG